jgi:hypothetical protein
MPRAVSAGLDSGRGREQPRKVAIRKSANNLFIPLSRDVNTPQLAARSFIVCALFGILFSGCGIIGGAFTLPGEAAGATPAGIVSVPTKGAGGETVAVNTPLPLQTITALPTGVPSLPAGCVDALSVTLDDYGKTLCAGGTVFGLSSSHGTYYVSFSNTRGKLYMMGTDWVDRIALKAGECAYAEGKLSRDGVSPVLPITPFTLKRCPVAPPSTAPTRTANLPANCAYALEVTRDDIGRKECVGGTVALSETSGAEYRIYFFTDKTLGLHLVATNWTGRGVNSGDCIYITNQVIHADPKTGGPILNVIPSQVNFCPAA